MKVTIWKISYRMNGRKNIIFLLLIRYRLRSLITAAPFDVGVVHDCQTKIYIPICTYLEMDKHSSHCKRLFFLFFHG